MKRDHLIRQLRKEAKAAGGELMLDEARGKGGHYVLRFQGRFSIIQSGEITPKMEQTSASSLAYKGREPMDYTAIFERDGDGWLVTFPALPEAITGGPTRDEARTNAVNGLEVTLLTYAKDRRDLPDDQPTQGDTEVVSPAAQVVAKVAFMEAFRKSGLSRVALAARMGKSENEVRRMLDPYYGSKLPQLEAGMRALGKRFVLTVEEAA